MLEFASPNSAGMECDDVMEFAKVEYFLWPPDKLSDVSDEFVARNCRVTILGNLLAVQALSATADPVTVATDYVVALRNRFVLFRLLTAEQFSALPPAAITFVGPSRHERKNHRSELREARQTLVASDHARLSQCYDYFQSAVDDLEHALSNLYKMVECIENEYGGERQAVAVLGPEMKDLKRLANGDNRDQRHAPSSPDAVNPATDVLGALSDGRSLLTKFEDDIVRRS
jgi:hypothetical protein